ncbi:MAG: cytochrome c [Elusimicrobia bacterium]|nr:cytochrome c [Elusimicrobiota bacterium]
MKFVLLLPVLFLASCGPDNRTPAEKGKAGYASSNCRQCHMIAGEGGMIGPDLTFVGFRKSPEFLDLWLKNPQAWQESTKMPTFNFTDQTRANIVAYLATLRGEGYAQTKPWNGPDVKNDPAMRGSVLFSKAGCSTCHGRGGAGGFKNNNVPGGKIPALRETASTYTKDELIRKIKNGVPHPQKADVKGPEPMLAMPTWGKVLADDEIDALAAYLLTLKPTTEAGW